jgi:Fe-S oxidoreductase
MLEFSESGKRVTYHDPCRLGRGMKVYDAPREILRAIPGLELVEMKNKRELSSCCGTSCWINCGGYSKLMQVNRLKEAAASGAEALVTTCWECAIHFRCTLRPEAWQQTSMEVEDLTVLAVSLLLG